MLLSAVRPACLLCLLAIAAEIHGDAQSPAGQAADLPREQIVYTTLRPSSWHLFLFEAGLSPKQITNDPALDYDATFSPDGRWVVFSSERSENAHLFALDLTRSGPPKLLTRGEFMDSAPTFTPDGKSLVFVSDREGNADIFTMPFRPDDPAAGDAATNLTHSPAGDFRPAVSPDGKLIAFSSDRDQGRVYPYQAEICVMNRDGSDVRRLTTSNAMNGSPVWSRDGHALFFYSDRESSREVESSRIWAMDSDGNHQRPLTPKELLAFSPAVMPNGRIAFAVKKPQSSNPLNRGLRLEAVQIMSVAADGSGLRLESATQDCRGPAFDHQHGRMVCMGEAPASRGPSFLAPGAHNEIRLPDRILEVQGVYSQFCSTSLDGRKIVTAQWGAGESGPTRLVVSDLDGSNAREIFRSPKNAPVWAMSWAHRIDLIAFTVGPQFAPDDAVVDIWTVRSDGSNPTNLTQGKFRNNAFPDLTADGNEIVFRSTRNGSKQIYLMNSDGTNVRPIAAGAAKLVNTMPAISPKGDMIAFSSDYQIYVQPLKDGGPDGPPRLFQKYSPSMHARFSPDGKWIVFASGSGWLEDEGTLSDGDGPPPYGEIFVAPVHGKSEPIRLTHNKWSNSLPCWGVMPRP